MNNFSGPGISRKRLNLTDIEKHKRKVLSKAGSGGDALNSNRILGASNFEIPQDILTCAIYSD